MPNSAQASDPAAPSPQPRTHRHAVERSSSCRLTPVDTAAVLVTIPCTRSSAESPACSPSLFPLPAVAAATHVAHALSSAPPRHAPAPSRRAAARGLLALERRAAACTASAASQPATLFLAADTRCAPLFYSPPRPTSSTSPSPG